MCKINQKLFIVLTILLIPYSVQAVSFNLFNQQQLMEAKNTYENNLIGVFREDLVRQLAYEHRQKLSNVKLNMPLQGEHPLQYGAQPWNKTIIIPISSVKFLDELTIVWAWFEENNCDTAYITSYLSSVLGKRETQEAPLQAFGLNMSVIKNKRVNSLSLKLHKSAIYFLMAHEAGHIVHNHKVNLKGYESQAQELAADNYALNAMASIGVMPAGMLQYFISSYMFEPFPDLKTWEYQQNTIGELTHPLASERLHNIANRLSSNTMDFAHSEVQPQKASMIVANAAVQISNIAKHMDNGGMKIYSASWLLKHYPKSQFRVACPIK